MFLVFPIAGVGFIGCESLLRHHLGNVLVGYQVRLGDLFELFVEFAQDCGLILRQTLVRPDPCAGGVQSTRFFGIVFWDEFILFVMIVPG